MNSLFVRTVFICSVDLRANLTCAVENATGDLPKTAQIPQNIAKQDQKGSKTGPFSKKFPVNPLPHVLFFSTFGAISEKYLPLGNNGVAF